MLGADALPTAAGSNSAAMLRAKEASHRNVIWMTMTGTRTIELSFVRQRTKEGTSQDSGGCAALLAGPRYVLSLPSFGGEIRR